MTGILDIASKTMLSNLNCLKIYDIMNGKYSKYYGFN
jgi:hypothetical protein